MGMHRELRMRKVLQAIISSAEFISIPTTTKFNKSVKYINDDKSLERCYVLLYIIFPCFRILRLADINLAGMGKVYYYLIMTKQSIEKTKSDLDYQRVFPDVSSLVVLSSRGDGGRGELLIVINFVHSCKITICQAKNSKAREKNIEKYITPFP